MCRGAFGSVLVVALLLQGLVVQGGGEGDTEEKPVVRTAPVQREANFGAIPETRFEMDLTFLARRRKTPIRISGRAVSPGQRLSYTLLDEEGRIVKSDSIPLDLMSSKAFTAYRPGKLIVVSNRSVALEVTVGSNVGITEIDPNPTPADNGFVAEYHLEQDSKITAEIVEGARTMWERDEGSKEKGPNELHWDGRDNDGQVVAEGPYLLVIKDEESSQDSESFVIQ